MARHATCSAVQKLSRPMKFGMLAFMMLVSHVNAASHLRRSRFRHGQPSVVGDSQAGWQDMSCFMDLARFGLTATSKDVVFQSGHAGADGTPEVLVVEDESKVSSNNRRILVFKSADGKCNEQAGSLCAVASDGSVGSTAFDKDEALLSSDGGASIDKCSTLTCVPDVTATLREPGASYVRTLVGATALFRATRNVPKQFLSIGLGAGTLAIQLQLSWPGSQQTVVELSSDVANAAQCFGVGSQQGLEIVTGDGRAYLESSADAAFDAVFVDAFDASDKVPACFTTKEFFNIAKSKIKAGGLLLMNAHTGKTLHNDLKDLLPAARSVFGAQSQLQVGKAPGLANAIILARAPGQGNASAVEFTQGAGDDLSSWFQDASFMPAENSQVSGPVLSDADVRCR